MHFFVRFLRCLVLTIGWIFFDTALVCHIFFVKNLLFYSYYSRILRDTKCVSFLCTTNWPPFKLELRVLLKLLKVVFVIAVFYLCKNVLQQLIGETVLLGTIADAPNVPPLFFLFTITSVNDFLVTVTGGATSYVVNISDVTGVGFYFQDHL